MPKKKYYIYRSGVMNRWLITNEGGLEFVPDAGPNCWQQCVDYLKARGW